MESKGTHRVTYGDPICIAAMKGTMDEDRGLKREGWSIREIATLVAAWVVL